MSGMALNAGAYKRVDVETASQGKLINLLFNGAIQRAEEAGRQLGLMKNQAAHDNLLRTQEIITELRGALDMNAGEIAKNLDRVYEYILHLLVQANLKKELAPIEEAVEHMTAMRDTWKDAFDKAASEEDAVPQTPTRPMVNIRG